VNVVAVGWRCRQGRGFFSVKKGAVMQSSKSGVCKWIAVTYLIADSLLSLSSRKLARDLGITQKSEWHMVYRIRKVLEYDNPELLGGIMELDKTFVGDKERNQHEHHQDRDTEDKAAAAEAVQRDTYGHNRGSTARQGCSSSFEQAVVSPSLLCLNF